MNASRVTVGSSTTTSPPPDVFRSAGTTAPSLVRTSRTVSVIRVAGLTPAPRFGRSRFAPMKISRRTTIAPGSGLVSAIAGLASTLFGALFAAPPATSAARAPQTAVVPTITIINTTINTRLRAVRCRLTLLCMSPSWRCWTDYTPSVCAELLVGSRIRSGLKNKKMVSL